MSARGARGSPPVERWGAGYSPRVRVGESALVYLSVVSIPTYCLLIVRSDLKRIPFADCVYSSPLAVDLLATLNVIP